MNHRSWLVIVFHLFPAPLVASSIDAGDKDELEDAAEHEYHAGQHPDVEEGDVGHMEDIIADLNIFIRSLNIFI